MFSKILQGEPIALTGFNFTVRRKILSACQKKFFILKAIDDLYICIEQNEISLFP